MTVDIWKSYVNCELRNEYESDLRSNEHYFSSTEKNLGLHWANKPTAS